MKRFGILLALLLSSGFLFAQVPLDSSIVQFSGLVLTEEDGELLPLEYVNVYFKENTKRGVSTDEDGFFSIVGRKGETVIFSAIGFATVEYTIPDSLVDNRYTMYQILDQEAIMLTEAFVYPWPSREHFKIEFLALDVTDELQAIADKNLANNILERMVEEVPSDGNESADYYTRARAQQYYYEGQYRPMNILNPIAWKKFIEAWKNGDFKSEKKK